MAEAASTLVCPMCKQTFAYGGHYNSHLKAHTITLEYAKGCASVEELEAACRVSDSSRMPWRM